MNATSTTADRPLGVAAGAQHNRARRLLEWGGFAAGAVMIVFGIVTIVMGFNGRSTVNDSLGQEKIVGSPKENGVAPDGGPVSSFAEGVRPGAGAPRRNAR